ncbi:restriction endonuclease subunit S, partial [Cellulomonas sp. 73-92]|uniref:restriction endonuclease subunit S n=1 Tax=Cellulomonas sp. 73-92 TaxID=1895740 RepID=UPI000B2896F5
PIVPGQKGIRVSRPAHDRDLISGSGLSEIGNVITGNTPPTRLGDAFDGDLPFITPGDVHHGTQIRDWQRTLSGVGQKSARVLPSGAVLTVCIGASIGKTGWIDRPSATNQQINAVVANSTSARPDYLAALFASPAFQRQITENASSTTLPILNKSKFERLAVPVAPRWTQDGLMSRLDTIRNMSADLGDASSAAERRSSSLRHALLAAAFSGRLTGRSSDLDIAEELMPA